MASPSATTLGGADPEANVVGPVLGAVAAPPTRPRDEDDNEDDDPVGVEAVSGNKNASCASTELVASAVAGVAGLPRANTLFLYIV